MPDTLISGVADTAFWIAHLRAAETARPDALFQDPFAARLAGERGRAIAAGVPWNYYVAWSVALRTVIIDDLILRAAAEGTDTVLNLGAGLDARPYRLALPADLRWIEADQPGVIAYKEEVLRTETPRCRLERDAVDLADPASRRAFLARALDGSRRALVLTEGVTPYLDEAEVAALARDLRDQSAVWAWVLDYNSPLMMRLRARQKGVDDHMKNAPFKFLPADWEALYRANGWRVGEMRYFMEEAARRGRGLPVSPWRQWMMGIVGIFASRARKEAYRTLAGYARMERLP